MEQHLFKAGQPMVVEAMADTHQPPSSRRFLGEDRPACCQVRQRNGDIAHDHSSEQDHPELTGKNVLWRDGILIACRHGSNATYAQSQTLGHTRPDRIGAAEKARTGRGRTQADCFRAPER